MGLLKPRRLLSTGVNDLFFSFASSCAHSSPLDANSKGIRLAVKVGGEIVLSVQKEPELPNPFQTAKVLIPNTETSSGCWCITRGHFTVQDVEARCVSSFACL